MNWFRKIFRRSKFDSSRYWESRYKLGGNSGSGSYNELASFKAELINSVVTDNKIETIIEFGCGDGQQLSHLKFHSYIGFDVSSEAIKICRDLYSEDKSKSFYQIKEYQGQKSELTLSLDVIYHLIEDKAYHNYMNRLFNASNKYIIIYSSNFDSGTNELFSKHLKHRKFTKWIDQYKPDFKLLYEIKNKFPYNKEANTGSLADFHIYKKEQ